MRVAISVAGKYHAFELARQLWRRNCLEQLITGYPGFTAREYRVPADKVISLPLNQLIYRGWNKLPSPVRNLYDPILLGAELFDRQARRRLKPSDIFVGWSGLCLRTLRQARAGGAVTLVERGSSHILFQQEIMREEYDRCGYSGPLPHPGIIERELREYEESDYIVVPSLFVKRTFLEKGFSGKKLIHNPYGVDLERFRPSGRPPDGIFRIIFAGSIGLRKGVHYLLKAFSELKLPKSELLLIGNFHGEIRPFWDKYRGSFTWVDSLPPEKLPEYFSSGSVFVLPSLEEGLALIQLQAMACGLPLICTPNTGGGDLIEDGQEGFIIPIRDVEALKERLLYLYRHPAECVAMGRGAEIRVRKNFSWDDYGDRTVANYQRIIDERSE